MFNIVSDNTVVVLENVKLQLNKNSTIAECHFTYEIR